MQIDKSALIFQSMKIIKLQVLIVGLLVGLLGSSQVGFAQSETFVDEGGEENPTSNQDAQDETEYIDQYTLPTSAAPVAVGGSMQTSMPVGKNTQDAINPPPGVNVDANTGFYPSLTIGYSTHDNPARSAGGEDVTDSSLRIVPALVYRGTVNNRHPYHVGVTGSYEEFDELTFLDNDFLVFDAAILLDMTEILKTDLYARHSSGTDPRGATATRELAPGEVGDEYDRNTLGGRVTVGRRSNTFQLVLDADTTDIDYTNNNQESRDRTDNGVGAGVYWNTGPRTSIFVNGRKRDIDYDSALSTSFDSEETSTTIGVGWEPSYTTSLLLEAGNLQKEFKQGTNQDYDDETYRAKLSWLATSNTSLGLYASRRTEESIDISSPFIISDLIGVSVQHAFTDRFRGQVYYNSIEDELVNLRDDDTTDYGLGVFYDFRRWLTFGASWQHTDRDSTDPIAAYESDSYNLTATFRTVSPVRFGDPELQTSSDVQTTE